MISSVFLVLAAAAVLSVYTVIGRLAIPPEERVPWRDLGWDGWVHTLRRSLTFLGDRVPAQGDPHPVRRSNVVASSARHAGEAHSIPENEESTSGPKIGS